MADPLEDTDDSNANANANANSNSDTDPECNIEDDESWNNNNNNIHIQQHRHNNGNLIYMLVMCLCSVVCLVVLLGTGPNNLYDEYHVSEKMSSFFKRERTTTTNNNNNNKNPQLVDIVLPKDYDDDDEKTRDNTSRCQTTLNALDQHFDFRRQMRQAHAPHHFAGRIPGLNELFDPYEPEAVCITEERFGHQPNRYQAFGDGPKFVCGVDMMVREASEKIKKMKNDKSKSSSSPPLCLIYSFGMIPDVDFEADLAKTFRNIDIDNNVQQQLCEIHSFNPAIATEGHIFKTKEATVYPWGLGNVDGGQDTYMGRTFETFTLQTIMNKLGHDPSQVVIDILRVDMERFEYEHMPGVLLELSNTNNYIQVNQLLLELHAFGIDDPTAFSKQIASIFDAVDKADLRIFHKERNGWHCGGAKCVEYAFASAKYLRKANAQLVCGHREDFSGLRGRR
jgi:hypothetical protein